MSPALTLAAAQLRADLRHRRTGRISAGRLATTVIAYGFSGAVLALSLGGASAEQGLFVASSFGMVLSAFGVVGSYDDLMGRPKDNAWLATLPAPETSHYAARLLGIGVYVGLMTLGIAVPVALRIGLGHGLVLGVLAGVGVALSIVWTALVALLTLWTLTLWLPRRPLRWALGIARTVLIGALVLGFQFVGADADALTAPWWPGAWLADALAGRLTVGLALFLGSLLALGLAFGAVFPRRYFRLLRRLADGARSDGARLRAGRQLTGPERLAVRPGPVRAAYGFAVAAFADDRLVRGRLWPAALLPAGFVVFGWMSGGLGSLTGFGTEGALKGTFEALQTTSTQLHLSVLVVLLFCIQSLIQTLQHSDHAEAAWIFDTLPDARPRVLQLGAQQALVWRVLFPLHVGIAVLLTATMAAADAVLHAGLWFAISALASRLFALSHGTPPFSRRADRFDAARRFGPLLVSIPAGVGAMILQVWALTTRGHAAVAILGMFALSAIIGEAVIRWRRPSASANALPVTPSTRPAPAQ